jgi:glycogenin glucosyltransferase
MTELQAEVMEAEAAVAVPVFPPLSDAIVTSTPEVMDAEAAVPVFPPRPDAIMTLITSDDFLPGVQTLLYSIKVYTFCLFSFRHHCCHLLFSFTRLSLSFFLKKNISVNIMYPPEVVVVCTSNVSEETRRALYPELCTRILQVEPLEFPTTNSATSSTQTTPWDNHTSGLSLIYIFLFQNYDTILYIDADCLVLKDVSHLLQLGKVYIESEALIAAAPDIFPPDKFNSGVMVVRPNRDVYLDLLHQASLSTSTYDGPNALLNAYFSEWYTDMPPQARLAFGYNAQRVLFDLTSCNGKSSYWDLTISPDLHIVHYSNAPKPWEIAKSTSSNNNADDSDSLTLLWQNWYRKSNNYVLRAAKERKEEAEKAQAAAQALVKTLRAQEQRQAFEARNGAALLANNPKQIHKLVTLRFKELRRQGKGIQDAMQQARDELQPEQEGDAGTQVAAMFGMARF